MLFNSIKNGLAPKGSSVLITRKLGQHNLMYYSIYSVQNWHGGLYGTTSDPGSNTVVPALSALVSMLILGSSVTNKFL